MKNNSVDFTGGEWWWPDKLEPTPDQYADFACDIMLPSAVENSWLAITCGTWYTLWINGKWIIHGPPREVAPWQYYDMVDLRNHLEHGLNRIRIRAYHLGISNQFHEACLPGLMLKGEISSDGRMINLGDRTLWRAANSPGFLPGAPRLNTCTIFGEHADLSIPSDAWLNSDQNPSWGIPASVARHPLPGREKLIPSDLPQFTGDIVKAKFLYEEGDWQIWDFSGEVFGFLQAEIESEMPNTCQILHGESIAGNKLPDYRFGGGDFREILELPSGIRKWESFEKRAMRFLALPKNVKVHQLAMREYHWPLTEIWRTSSETGRLDKHDHAIITAAARTIILCCDDLLNDCPRRERAQYNDPALYMTAFPRLFGTWEPYRRFLYQFMRGANSDGVLRACYPGPAKNNFVIPDFCILFAINLRRYFDATGDLETMKHCFPAALAGVRAFEKYADASGLLANLPGWVFLCNSFEVAKHPRSSGLNALWSASWEDLSLMARHLGEQDADAFHAKSVQVREAWRNCFYRDGLILDSDKSSEHQQSIWWNYHYEADKVHFAEDNPGPRSFILLVKWRGSARRMSVASPGRVRAWSNGILLLDKTPKNPWQYPHPFHPWECELPAGFESGDLLFEVALNAIDNEIYISLDGGKPGSTFAGEHSSMGIDDDKSMVTHATRMSAMRPWTAPRFSQISTGYAVACGMLNHAESIAALRACIRKDYHVPWLKRTTPLICVPTDDPNLIAQRVVLCNTPHSLFFFCRALGEHGMKEDARELCRRLFGLMVDKKATTLWEEFAPRSSLCHAWSAMCIEYIY